MLLSKYFHADFVAEIMRDWDSVAKSSPFHLKLDIVWIFPCSSVVKLKSSLHILFSWVLRPMDRMIDSLLRVGLLEMTYFG